ncbi:MAG: hypothetical protein ACOYK9_05745 [Chlamydiia bacterium]
MINKKFQFIKDGKLYLIEEDVVGWYLIVYEDKAHNKSLEDYLVDTFEEAIFEAEDKFGIKRTDWVQINMN